MTRTTTVVCCISVTVLAILALIGQANCRETGLFVHITDIHFDALYKEGAKLEPKEPPFGERIGCRVIDQKIPKNQTSGRFGALGGYCDIPKETVDSALQFIAKFTPKIDFILYGGDNNAHDWFHQTPDQIVYAMSNVSQLFKKYFYGNTPVFPVIGNHESFPIDEFAPDYETVKWFMEPNYNLWIDMFGNLMDKENLDNYKTKGYYTVQITPGLRLLALNSVLHMTRNIFVKYLPPTADPFGEIAFIEKTLANAQAKGEKVIILGHVPAAYDDGDGMPGEFLESFLTKFTDLTIKYQKTIAGQFYGHTHFNSFALGRNTTTGIANSVAQITSSLTTWSSVNPGFKIYVYDKQDFKILDSWIMYTDLKKSNARGSLVWEKLTALSDESKWGDSFTKFGGLTVEAFQDFANRMTVNDKGAWNAFSSVYTQGATFDSFENKKFVCNTICQIQYVAKEQCKQCMAKCP